MNKFDKIQIEIDINAFQVIHYEKFDTTMNCDGELISWTYKQTTPYWLKVNINPHSNKVYIEFTGKILSDFYTELISTETIYECIGNLHSEQLFVIEPNDLIDFGKVTGCDITRDIETNYTVEDLYRNLSLKNNKKYSITSINQPKTSFTISNTVADRRSKESLIIYDKENEIRKASNKPFLDFACNPEEILDYFKGKVRLELNLHSVNRIRKHFNIPSGKPTLYEILHYDEDIILKFLNDILPNVDSVQILKNSIVGHKQKLMVLLRILFLCLCGFDASLVEKTIRDVQETSSGISRNMEPFLQLINEIHCLRESEINGVKEFTDMQKKLEELILTYLPVEESSVSSHLLELYEKGINCSTPSSDAP